MRSLSVTSLDDPRIAVYRELKDAELRERDGVFVCEGRLGVRRLVESARFRPRSVLVTPAARDALRPTLDALDDATPVYVAEPSLLHATVGYKMHRGCVAAAERGDPSPVEALLPAGAVPRRILVMDHLANPDNVGGLFRNAMAFGAGAVVLCPRSADPLYRKAIRVSMGGALSVPFGRSRDWSADLRLLKQRGVTLVALSPRADAIEIGDVHGRLATAGSIALLLGSESEGLSPDALEAADIRVRISMADGVDSLNVATAGGIALHALSRIGAE